MAIIFISGIGTGIGKTLVSAIVAEALGADYWKPVQAGYDDGTDTEWIKQHIHNGNARVHPEVYKLKMPASPHIAAREENVTISIEKICSAVPKVKGNLVIEGAGGLMVPLNGSEFVVDLIRALNAKVILVSRNYLGSINHSILSGNTARQMGLSVLGWIFNDHYLNYENEIAGWTNYPRIGSIPFTADADQAFVAEQAGHIKAYFENFIW